jgi:N utilization substance protein A
MTEELAQRLVEQGYLSYDDLSVIEPDALMEMGGLTEEQVDVIVNQAEELAAKAEKAADEEKRRKKEEEAAAAAAAASAPPAATQPPAAAPPAAAPPAPPVTDAQPEPSPTPPA